MDRLGGSFGPHDADDHFDYDAADASMVEAPPSPVGQDERRMQVRAYNHWASQLGDRNFPLIEDLYPEELGDFGPYSVLLDFSLGIENPAVQYLGAKLAEECDAGDQHIETLEDVPSRSLLSRITDHYMQILANQAPIGFEAEFVNQRGATVLYRGILLPYSSDDQTIDFIYGVINWKEMADQRTADALLLEIDQALGDHALDDADDVSIETAETLTAVVQPPVESPWDDDDVLDLGVADIIADEPTSSPAESFDDLPVPAFGHAAEPASGQDNDSVLATARAGRSVDALGNPLGAGAWQDESVAYYEDADAQSFDNAIKTAADYGLPEWDDEPESEDVEGVVDPLADDGVSSSLTSLVSRGMRTKKAVDLSQMDPTAPIPQAYEGEPVALHGLAVSPSAEEPAPDLPAPEENEPVASDSDDDRHADDAVDTPAPEGLYDCLASARELALAALSTEDRSRKTLYAAVDRAYDFSFEAEASPEDYAELIADNGLTVQERAPMTPIVKLVFGAEYDKTRLTEYAAVLMHAHRLKVERGEVANWLRKADGGLKGIVNAERRARKEEQGKPVEETDGIRAALAKKLRALAPVTLDDLPDHGGEFALVMVRRVAGGRMEILGEVPEDVPLLEKAARKLVA